MTVENTALQEEVDEITSQQAKPVHFRWEALISMTGQVDIDVMKVMGLDFNRDYEKNVGDEIMVELVLPMGTYQHQVLPNKSNLTITLKRTLLEEGTGSAVAGAQLYTQAYRGIVMDSSSMALEGNSLASSSPQAANLLSTVSVKFQLKDLTVEQSRMQSTGGIVKGAKVGDTVKALVTQMAQNLSVDKNHQIKGVQMTDANNDQVYDHISIPHGTRAMDIPAYIEHHYGAPYSAGMGSYIQEGIWWIYPLYDLTQYDKAKKTLTVINIPKNRMPNANRTYRTTYNQVILLCTGQVAHADVSEHLQLDQGNGSRYADATQLFDNFATVKDNKATAYRATNVNEVLGQNRPTGLNNIQKGSRAITANPMLQLSQLSQRLGSVLSVTWENSLPSLITPGMPCRFMYEINGQIFEVKGSVIKTQTHMTPIAPGILPCPHRSMTAITLFVTRLLDWSDSAVVTGS
jgi:hypothetical protein